MKKAIFLAAFTILGAGMVSCNSEDTYEAPDEKSVTVKDFEKIDFSEAWKGIKFNIDFSRLFNYSNVDELKVKSDKTFAEMITEARDLIEESEEGITDLVSTIEVKAGEAHIKQLVFLENNLKKEIVEYNNGDGKKIKSGGVYNTPKDFTLLTDDLEGNSNALGNFLSNNLKADSDSIILEVRVNAGKASVFVFKA